MKNLRNTIYVTGYGGSVLLGEIKNEKFIPHVKLPRKTKKAIHKLKPWLSFHKDNFKFLYGTIDKKLLRIESHFQLRISSGRNPYNDSTGTERQVYFSLGDKIDKLTLCYKYNGDEVVYLYKPFSK
jgi:hypothetical protein